MAVIKLHVKKDDLVMVVAGKDKGKSGKVLRVLPEKSRVLVENLNVVKRHTRPSQANNEGGIIEKEAPIAISNLMIMCEKCDGPVRMGKRLLEDGRRVRTCRQCGDQLDR